MHTLEQIRSGALNGTNKISLNKGLTQFPEELYLLADSLEVLDLSNNNLNRLPDDFGRFTKLKAVFFSNNCFEHIPAVLAECRDLDIYGFRFNKIKVLSPETLSKNLRWLILTGNKLEQIPEEIGLLARLQKCMLAGNRLTRLPVGMQKCTNLELLRISANRLTELPNWLLAMPKLTWLAYAGNPLHKKPTPSPLQLIEWSNLEIQNELGRGASGIIYQANWKQNENLTKKVAVKVFKGAMTSDGSPIDERDICILADQHKNLVPLLGQIANHPDAADGLVLGLIPDSFRNMAEPPSLVSCTRDTYQKHTYFTVEQILSISRNLASVANHLHKKGILHGDFYPHNTLLNDHGDCLLGDFGAASYYDRQAPSSAFALERLEVRAFGCSLEDMLLRCNEKRSTNKTLESLTHLKQRCMQEEVTQRPGFTEIFSELTAM